jgi:hypothetical protein
MIDTFLTATSPANMHAEMAAKMANKKLANAGSIAYYVIRGEWDAGDG